MSSNAPVGHLAAKHSGQIVTIQYLRALAAFGVLLFHGGNYRIGAAGVDVFFVISGFIMTGSASRREWHVGSFALHRIIRIVPMYWLVTIAFSATALILPSMFKRLHPNLEQIVTSLLFIPHLDGDGQAWPLIVQGWSLNLEVLFYCLFASSLALPRFRTAFLTTSLAILALSSLLLDRHNAWTRSYCNPMFLEFLAGVIAGHLWLRGNLPRPGLAVTLIVAAFAAFAATSLLHANLAAALPQHAEWERVLVWGVPAFALTIGVLGVECHWRIYRSRACLLLGEASYSLYLAQGLVNPIVSKLTAAYHVADLVPLAIGVAIGLHLIVEKPMTQRLRLWIRQLGYT